MVSNALFAKTNTLAEVLVRPVAPGRIPQRGEIKLIIRFKFLYEISFFPAILFAGRSEIGQDIWLEITEDKNLAGFFFSFLWNILVATNQILAMHF